MSPRREMRSPILLDSSLLDVLGRALAVKGLWARPSGVMKRNLFRKRSSLVVGAFPRELQRFPQFLMVPSIASVKTQAAPAMVP